MSMSTKTRKQPLLPWRRGTEQLLADELPCRACGIAVKQPATVEKVRAYWRERRAPMPVVEAVEEEFSMTICPSCSQVRARAAALVANNPRVFRVLGSPSHGIALIEAALVALDALAAKNIDALASDQRGLKLLMKFLPIPGSDARWDARFSPTVALDADQYSCSRSPWSHLSDAQAQDLRDAYAALLRARTEKPRPVAPPDDGLRGCLLCGVGTVTALPSAEDVWGRRWNAAPHTLGGRARPDQVHGYLCPTCTPFAESVGALGPTALERALVSHLGVTLRVPIEDVEISGLKGWGGLPTDTPPNPTPWEHETDLKDLARRLREV